MRTTIAALSAAALTSLALPLAAHAAPEASRPSTYTLTGDDGGSKFEGIGADTRTGVFYVSETTGGEIHRGSAGSAVTSEWLAGDGTDGRFTARGITVDGQGRVYIAGGPNRLSGAGLPDVWVYGADGTLLAALRLPGDDVFVNDVAIGSDGAAYFTNSNAPQVFRVAESATGWTGTVWADAAAEVTRAPGFNLGGIVLSEDGSALVVAQGNVGVLWRFDLVTGAVSRVDTGATDLTNADGLVRQGSTLTVVRNFSRMVTTLRLTDDGTAATFVRARATDPSRVLTTAKVLRGRMLFVDSKFDEAVATPPYEVVTDPFVR